MRPQSCIWMCLVASGSRSAICWLIPGMGHHVSNARNSNSKSLRPSLRAIAEQDFKRFVDSIHLENEPNGDPTGFRDRLICFMLKEGGFRLGELLGMHLDDLEFGNHGGHVRFRPDNENGARAKAGYGRDRFVHLPDDVLGLLDVYLTEVWIEANPGTDHLWIVLKSRARGRDGKSRYGTALSLAAVENMFRHYSKKSGVLLASSYLEAYACNDPRPFLPARWGTSRLEVCAGAAGTCQRGHDHANLHPFDE